MTRWPGIPVCAVDFLSSGRDPIASRNVPTTLTAIVVSIPAVVMLWRTFATPALATTASSRSRADALWTNRWMEVKSAMSSSQTSQTSSRPVEELISTIAAAPLAAFLHPRMTLEAPSRTKWRAASSPRPVLAPVMTMVWFANEQSGRDSLVN